MISPALYQCYNRLPLRFMSGSGSWLIAENGERYLDYTAGIAVNSLGHNHPYLVSVLKSQADGLWHVSNLFDIPQQNMFAERLCAASFADQVFMANSGGEAMECALKSARRYHFQKGALERTRIITFEGAFHGRTLATLAAGGQEKYMQGFAPNMDGFDQVPFGDHEALRAAITQRTAAILIEPIQGEGGIRPVPPQCLRGLRALCDEHGILLIFDEVQCGAGRTGTLFAHQISGIAPDILAVAKGIGGGFPLGACLATREVAQAMGPGAHGSTFGGNPLAMAVGNAVLDVLLGDGFLEQVKLKSLRLRQKLAGLVDTNSDIFAEVRGEGLMLGLRTHEGNQAVIEAVRNQHLLTVPAGTNIVRLLPPLTTTDEEIDLAVTRLDRGCQTLRAQSPCAIVDIPVNG